MFYHDLLQITQSLVAILSGLIFVNFSYVYFFIVLILLENIYISNIFDIQR